MYRGAPPLPPVDRAPPPREGLDPAWLWALALGAGLAVWGWSTVGLLGAVVFGVLGFTIALARTRRYARWKRARALAEAQVLWNRVVSEEEDGQVTSAVRIAEAATDEAPLDPADETDTRALRR